MDESIKATVERLETALTRLRPYTRLEFQDILNKEKLQLDQEKYKRFVFDYESSPFIEKDAIESSQAIVAAISPTDYRDTALFVLTCLQRLELFFFEKFREPDMPEEDKHQRSIMYRTGCRKVMRSFAAELTDPAAGVWRRRRKLLDGVETELLRIEMGIAEFGTAERERLVSAGDCLLSFSPTQLRELSSESDLEPLVAKLLGDRALEYVSELAGRS
jgi:hypothetical protein